MSELDEAALSWLLEEDEPGVRYIALRDLLRCSQDDPVLLRAKEAAHATGPIAGILSQMQEPGYWLKPGPGYFRKYKATVWSVITLGQLGASMEMDSRIARVCHYVLEHSLTPGGQFSINGTPSGTVDCLQGNLCAALLDLGSCDPRLDLAFDWMARTVTGEGVAPASERDALRRYYAGKCGPTFCCGANNKLSCAWGATKVMIALGKLPAARRTPAIEAAIAHGIDFLLSVDPAEATYPSGYAEKPSGNWWKFGFPVFYVTDVLQVVEALVALGLGSDPRLANALALVRSKQDDHGRWSLEYDYSGKMWVDFGKKKEPNKWVTLRALRALQGAGYTDLPGKPASSGTGL
jgi:hypothetical protein